ncbi:MAG: hemerythrin domain-containing protein [Methanomassiliicoccus sp.]|nr:hemerythrin domain-containing protein [Methanomassiliicoccus sp.]
MNIVDRLMDDHREIMSMLTDLLNGPIDDAEKYSKKYIEMMSRIEAHERGEERTVYETLSSDLEVRPIALQAMEEHRLVRQLLRELADVEITEEVWLPRLVVANNIIALHVQIEEGNVLPLIQESLNESQREDLDRRFQMEKESIMTVLRS